MNNFGIACGLKFVSIANTIIIHYSFFIIHSFCRGRVSRPVCTESVPCIKFSMNYGAKKERQRNFTQKISAAAGCSY